MNRIDPKLTATLRQPAELIERGLAPAADLADLERIAARYAIHAPDTLRPIYRFVCSWATTDEDVDAVLALLP